MNARASQVLGKPENNHLIKDTIGISTLNGVAFERVYEAGHGRKISELEWDISNLLMLDLSRSFEVFPNVYIGVGLSKAINSGFWRIESFTQTYSNINIRKIQSFDKSSINKLLISHSSSLIFLPCPAS